MSPEISLYLTVMPAPNMPIWVLEPKLPLSGTSASYSEPTIDQPVVSSSSPT